MGEEGLTKAGETPKGLEKADVAGASPVCPSREGADGLHGKEHICLVPHGVIIMQALG